jgi:hypothetical protein
MKIKGISVFEQHVEKFVLGAAVLIALFFAAIQFLGPGNTVEIDGTNYAAGDVDDALREKAEDIRAQLDASAPATVSAPESPRVFEWFESARRSSVAPPRDYLAAIPARATGLGGGTLTPQATTEFVVPVLAGTGVPWVEQHSDAISAETAADLPQSIRDQLVAGPSGSYDLSWTTVAAILDMNALRAQIAAEDPEGVKTPIPTVWYGERIDIVDLELVRQRLVDGNWQEEVVVDPIFESIREYRDRINRTGDERPSVADRNAILDWLREPPGENQALIIQPTFHATAGSSWTEPVMPIADEQDPAELFVLELQRRLAAADRQIADLESRLEAAGGPPPEAPQGNRRQSDEGRGRTGGGGGGRGGPELPGGSGAGIEDPDDVEGGANLGVRARLYAQLNSEIAKRGRLQADLEEAADAAGIELNPQDKVRVFPNLLTDASLVIWAHDMTAQQGEVYRYRLRVRIANPFFAKEDLLLPPQQPLAQSLPMDVEPSEWTPAVTIKSHTRYFVTSAQPDEGAFNTGRVKLELYRMIDGQWHRKVLDLQPGDPIVDSTEVRGQDNAMHRVDFQTGAYVLDVIRNPRQADGVSSALAGKVVIALSDGTTTVRDPGEDSRSLERLTLAGSADAVERQQSAGP